MKILMRRLSPNCLIWVFKVRNWMLEYIRQLSEYKLSLDIAKEDTKKIITAWEKYP